MDYFFLSERDAKASQNPMLVMVDEQTGEKFARATGQKGLGLDGELERLVSDMVNELHAWGQCGGEGSRLIMKSDGETAIKAVRDAVANKLGGRVVLEQPAKGESASNGVVEEAGKSVREFARLFRSQLEEKIGLELKAGSPVAHSLSSNVCIQIPRREGW